METAAQFDIGSGELRDSVYNTEIISHSYHTTAKCIYVHLSLSLISALLLRLILNLLHVNIYSCICILGVVAYPAFVMLANPCIILIETLQNSVGDGKSILFFTVSL